MVASDIKRYIVFLFAQQYTNKNMAIDKSGSDVLHIESEPPEVEPITRECLRLFKRSANYPDGIEIDIAGILDLPQREIDQLGPASAELVHAVHQTQTLGIRFNSPTFTLSPTAFGTVAYPTDEALATELLRLVRKFADPTYTDPE
jgi:hypothetical protein